jgi:hypothetical protein
MSIRELLFFFVQARTQAMSSINGKLSAGHENVLIVLVAEAVNSSDGQRHVHPSNG